LEDTELPIRSGRGYQPRPFQQPPREPPR